MVERASNVTGWGAVVVLVYQLWQESQQCAVHLETIRLMGEALSGMAGGGP